MKFVCRNIWMSPNDNKDEIRDSIKVKYLTKHFINMISYKKMAKINE